MKTKLFLFALAQILFAEGLFAQSQLILAKPSGSKTWGFLNLKGEYVIEPTYRKVGEFSKDGFAVVAEDGFYFINTKGEKLETEVNGFRVKNFMGFGFRGFSDGLAPVQINKKWGYLNTDGQLVIKNKYEKVSEFKGGYATAMGGGQWYIIDKSGNETSISIPGLKNVRDLADGMAIFDTQEKKFGFINTKGEVVIEAKFASLGDFHNGMAWAKDFTTRKAGYINQKGEWVIKPTYDATRNFDSKSGMARVKVGENWFYIDAEGNKMKMQTDKYDDFHEGLARGRQGELFGYFDKSGKWVISPHFESARDFKNGYAAAKFEGKWGIINSSGEWVIEPKYDGIRDVVIIP